METRNIIKSGPSSYVVSLPMGWVKKNKLGKGDFLYMDERDNNLTYSVSSDSDDEAKSLTIRVDGKSDENIVKLLKSAYLTNYNMFILLGESVKTRAKIFREILHQLVAVEIMEQTSSKIVAHEMLDKKKNSPEKIIRRMDMILRGIFEDIAGSMGKKNNIGYILERELDLNRLYLLAQRLIINALEAPSYAHELKKTNFDVLMEFKLITFLEMIGDSLKECANANPSSKYGEYFTLVHDMYHDVINAYYRNDLENAVKISSAIPFLEKKLDRELQKSSNSQNVVFFMPLKEIVLQIDEIALVVLNKNT